MLWDALERSRTLWGALGCNGARGNARERSVTLWGALERNGARWDALERSGTLWDALGYLPQTKNMLVLSLYKLDD